MNHGILQLDVNVATNDMYLGVFVCALRLLKSCVAVGEINPKQAEVQVFKKLNKSSALQSLKEQLPRTTEGECVRFAGSVHGNLSRSRAVTNMTLSENQGTVSEVLCGQPNIVLVKLTSIKLGPSLWLL